MAVSREKEKQVDGIGRKPQPKKTSEKRRERILSDLKSGLAIKIKGVLFLALGLISGGTLLANAFTWSNLLLLAICIWAFCRFYYFGFYVLHHYVDPNFTYSGLTDLVKYLISGRKAK